MAFVKLINKQARIRQFPEGHSKVTKAKVRDGDWSVYDGDKDDLDPEWRANSIEAKRAKKSTKVDAPKKAKSKKE